MSVESDAASQVASIYTQGIKEASHVAVKILGEVFQISKELAKLLFTKGIYEGMIKEEGKQAGKLKLNNLLRKSADKGFPLNILEVKSKENFKTISKELERNGVMFVKAGNKDNYNIILTEDYAPIFNRIIEKYNLNSVEKVADSEIERTSDSIESDIDVNTAEVTIDDDDLLIGSKENYESKSAVNLSKSTDEKDKTEVEVKEQPDPYTEGNHYNNALPIDKENIGEEVDIDELERAFREQQKSKSESPLDKDGERSAPSETKSNSEGLSNRIKSAVSDEKEKLAEQASEAKDSVDDIKESVEDISDTFGGK